MPLYCASSTRFGSIRMSFTSVGVAFIRMLSMIAFTHTLLPDPVAPAISRCGIFDRSALNGWPATSWPSAKASLERSDASRVVSAGQDLLQRHQVEGGVRDLDADVRLAGDRRLDADAAGGQRQRQVVGQCLDAAQLDAGLHLERVLRDDRAFLDARHLHPDAEVRRASRGCGGPWRTGQAVPPTTRARRPAGRAAAGPSCARSARAPRRPPLRQPPRRGAPPPPARGPRPTAAWPPLPRRVAPPARSRPPRPRRPRERGPVRCRWRRAARDAR